jgi:hypothetical protein
MKITYVNIPANFVWQYQHILNQWLVNVRREGHHKYLALDGLLPLVFPEYPDVVEIEIEFVGLNAAMVYPSGDMIVSPVDNISKERIERHSLALRQIWEDLKESTVEAA